MVVTRQGRAKRLLFGMKVPLWKIKAPFDFVTSTTSGSTPSVQQNLSGEGPEEFPTSLLTLRLANFTDSFGSTRQKHLSNISASVVALTETSVESTADSAQ
ncbi:hypothetical protein PGT21_014489 [Puccinia graminis f. sp. tritici]|uniref:Uncharacterized protein n=1 Tax=Puccinia graminis f. sp. tritici TaxID=56615 RepID=A0A5B0NDR8_PUCGR|nr:hypothetical protein PGT21_014489 [Puccinia graminis f. sp. tritici]